MVIEIASVLLAVALLDILVQYVVDIINGICPVTQVGQVKLPSIYAALVGIVVYILVKADIYASLGFQI